MQKSMISEISENSAFCRFGQIPPYQHSIYHLLVTNAFKDYRAYSEPNKETGYNNEHMFIVYRKNLRSFLYDSIWFTYMIKQSLICTGETCFTMYRSQGNNILNTSLESYKYYKIKLLHRMLYSFQFSDFYTLFFTGFYEMPAIAILKY